MNFSVLNWNIQGIKYYTSANFNKIAPLLERSQADVLCLQEAQEMKKDILRFSRSNTLKSVLPENVDYGSIILSKFPIIDNGELILPRLTNKHLGNALWADIEAGDKIVRFYNCHFDIVGVGPKQRADQLKFVLSDSKRHIGPVIICGDFNTTIPPAGIKRKIVQWFHKEQDKSLILDGKYFHNDERYIFVRIAEQEGFREATDISKSTWCIPPFGWELFNLKLDWFPVRDLELQRVSLGDYISDHRAILAECLIS